MQVWLFILVHENGEIVFRKNMEHFMEQKWKTPIPGKSINMKEKEDIMRMSLFLWGFQFTLWDVRVSHKVNTHTVFYPATLRRSKEECKRLSWCTECRLWKMFNKREVSEKKSWLQGLSIPRTERSWQCQNQRAMNVHGQSAVHEICTHFYYVSEQS